MRGRPAAIGALFLFIVTSSLARGALRPEDAAGKSVAQCEELRLAHPRDIVPYICLFQAAQRGERDAARRKLDAILAIDPKEPRALLYRGLLAVELREPDAEARVRAAIPGFVAEGDLRGETWSRITLAWNVYYQGRRGETKAELDRAFEAAQKSADQALVGEVEVSFGWLLNFDAEHGQAWTMLKRAELKIGPDGPINVRVRLMGALAAAAWGLDLLEDAFAYSRRHLELALESQPALEAGVRTNMALIARGLVRQGLMSEDELVDLKRQALDAAIRTGHPTAEARGHLLLSESLEGEEGLAHARRGLEIARGLHDRSTLVWALWVTAEHLARGGKDGSEEALSLVGESEQIAMRIADPEGVARSRLVRSVILWNKGEHALALDDLYGALDQIERIRDRQTDREARARVFSRFAHAYRRTAGFLLDGPGPYDVQAIEKAMQVMERLRARSLLDRLDAIRVTERLLPDDPAGAQRVAILADIAAIQRRLIQAGLDDAARERALEDLDRLEVEERAIRQELARSHPRFGTVRVTVPPSLAELQAEIAPDEALVSYLAGPARGTPWHAIVLTADRVEAFALADLDSIEQETDTYLALLERRDGRERKGAARLERLLLASVLESLPTAVRTLVVIPDGPLHRMPFGSLRAEPEGPSLAERFDVSIAPSHAAWLRFRHADGERPRRSLLALADPAVTIEDGTADWRSTGSLRDVASLGRLPRAVAEVRAARGALGGESVLLTGERASEAAIKALDLRDFRVLHLAAHALVDERNPDRSAVLLAPGSPDEDGLLQYREVVDLDLHGPIIILSACRSGSGPLIGGDGVLGLAQAFFLAGSRTVVASLWPLRDDEAAALVGRFARALGEGRSVTSALGEAQRGMIAAGAPPAAWAGLAVLGDGDRVLFEHAAFGWRWALALALLAAALAFWLVRTLVNRSVPPRD